ncbi:hypothetical protein VPH35_086746 [Triticum aestivum]
MPLIVAPPCLLRCPKRFAFAHVRVPVANPSTIIRMAIQSQAGNPSFIMGSSWRGAACLTFDCAATRSAVLHHAPFEINDNLVSLEPVEDADRSIAVFSDLVEIETIEFPHELWHDEGIRFPLNFLGDVCAVDQFYLTRVDYSSVRTLILAQAGKPSPDGVIIQLPPLNEIKVSKVKEITRWAHGDGANPFGYDSSDGDRWPASRALHAACWGHCRPGPLPMQATQAIPAGMLQDHPPTPMPMPLTPACFNHSPGSPFQPHDKPTAANPSSSRVSSMLPTTSLPISDLEPHECAIRKQCRKKKRVASFSKDVVRRTTRLAGKDARTYTPMTLKAAKAKATRFSKDDVAKALDDAIVAAALDDCSAPLASAEDLAAITLLCGAEDDQAAEIIKAGNKEGDDHAP